jgi:hypothetical protein
MSFGDHPHNDPGDGRSQCDVCGKFVWPALHSCKGVRVAAADPDAKHFSPGLPSARPRAKKQPCGDFVADGHGVFDPNCGACVEANSDAPEWTI